MTTATARAVAPFDGHHGRVHTVTFTAGTDELASGGEDGTIRLWDVARGVELRSAVAHPGGVTAAVVVGDGTRLATTGADRRLGLWNRCTGERLPLSGPDRVDALAGAVGSDRLAVAATGSVRIIDLATGDQLGAFAAPDRVQVMAMSADGATLAWTGTSGTVVVWDLGTGTSTRVSAHPGGVSALALCPAGQWLVTGDADGAVRLWDLDTRTETQALGTHSAPVRAVAISDDRRLVVSGGDDGVIHAAEPGVAGVSAVGAHPGGVCALAVGPGAGLVASGGGDRTVRLWGPETPGPRPALAGHRGGVSALAVSRDGRRLISGGEDQRVRVWDLATGALTGRVLSGAVGAARAVGSRTDDVTVIAAGDDGVIWTWDPVTGRSGTAATGRPGGQDRPGGPGAVTAAAIGPDGRRAVTGGLDGALTVWDARTGSRTAVMRGHRGRVDGVVVTGDGRAVVTAGSDRTVRVWDLASGAEQRILTTGPAVGALAVTPDAATVIVGGADGAILGWPVDLTARSGTADRPAAVTAAALVAHHGAPVTALAVTPDGRHIVSGGTDGTIRLWRRSRPVHPLVLPGHTGAVRTLVVTPDGSHIVSGGDDGTIRVWDRSRGLPVAGTGLDRPATARVPAPALGLVSDAPSAQDGLSRGGDVDAVAALLADRGTEGPLTLAVLGPPGSGTSSFLRQVHDRVNHLAGVSRANPGRSPAVATVRQIRLDAGHLTGDTAWIGLVDQLAGHLADAEGVSDPDDLSEEGSHLRREVAAVRDRLDRLERGLATHRRHRLQGTASLLAALARPDLTDRRRVRGSVTALALVTAGAVALAGLGRLEAGDAVLVVLAGALVATLPLFTGSIAAARRVRRRSGLRGRAEQHRLDLHGELHAGQDLLDRLDAAGRLATLAREAREGRPPLVGGLRRAHADLRQLDEDLAAARAEWQQAGSPGPPPLERVIVHVDGLDRCPARTALDLLAALHWLLNIPLFTVVVAADPGWLTRTVSAGPDELDRLFPLVFGLRPLGAEADALLDALIAPTGGPLGPVPAPGGRATAADTPGSGARAVTLDPQPDRLSLRDPERALLVRLRPLLDTPRAIKRYVNLYRLVRLGVPDADLPGFIGPDGTGPHQAVAALLALTVTSPAAARTLFLALRRTDADEHVDVWELLDRLSGCGRPGSPEGELRRFADLLADVRRDIDVPGDLARFRRAAGNVARFSVETCDLVAPAQPA